MLNDQTARAVTYLLYVRAIAAYPQSAKKLRAALDRLMEKWRAEDRIIRECEGRRG